MHDCITTEKAQIFHFVSKDIKLKASGLFKLIECFKKYQNLAVITIVKEF